MWCCPAPVPHSLPPTPCPTPSAPPLPPPLSSLIPFSLPAPVAVKVRVSGGAALDLLQKLTYVVLPSQNGFKGVSARSFDKGGNLHFRCVRVCCCWGGGVQGARSGGMECDTQGHLVASPFPFHFPVSSGKCGKWIATAKMGARVVWM